MVIGGFIQLSYQSYGQHFFYLPLLFGTRFFKVDSDGEIKKEEIDYQIPEGFQAPFLVHNAYMLLLL